MELIDISRTISPSTAVWPGDQEVEWSWTSRLGEDNASVNLGSIQCTTHVATHVDAPLHVKEGGMATEDLPLSSFVGSAQVLDVGGASMIRPEHVEDIRANRVLFKTKASTLSDEEWPESVAALDPDTVSQLAADDVYLVGTDAPSVDPLNSTSLPAHHALVEAGIVNIEGLRLDGVSPGIYFLMALPLKILGGDATPVRAVLYERGPK